MQRLPRFLREYRGEVPGCPGWVGAYENDDIKYDVVNLFYCVISVQTMHCIHVFTEFRRENVPVYHNALYLCKSSTHYWLKQALNEFCVDVQFCHELISIIHYQWILLVFVFVYYCCICTVTWNYIYYRCVILLTYFSMCILCMLLAVSNIE